MQPLWLHLAILYYSNDNQTRISRAYGKTRLRLIWAYLLVLPLVRNLTHTYSRSLREQAFLFLKIYRLSWSRCKIAQSQELNGKFGILLPINTPVASNSEPFFIYLLYCLVSIYKNNVYCLSDIFCNLHIYLHYLIWCLYISDCDYRDNRQKCLFF